MSADDCLPDRNSGPDLHVPVVGELVSPQSGSAVVTVARELARARQRAGGSAALVVRSGRAHKSTDIPLVEYSLDDPVVLSRWHKGADLLAAEATGRTPLSDRRWRPVVQALEASGPAYAFLHNSPTLAASLHGSEVQPVVYLHNDVTRGWSRRRIARLVESTPVVTVSRFLANQLFGSRFTAHVLPLVNGVDTVAFHPAVSDAGPVVLFVGKMAPHKGPHLLIEAARALFEEGLRFRVLLVGSSVLSRTPQMTDYERELRALATPLGDWVEFEPFVDRYQIAATYRRASIAVVPSDWDDPCPLTAVEAMASGLACVVSRRGGLPEACDDGATYFESGDPAELAQRLRPLITDSGLRQQAGARARDRAEKISWDRQYDRLDTWLTEWRPMRGLTRG